jgi:hypothetical protein
VAPCLRQGDYLKNPRQQEAKSLELRAVMSLSRHAQGKKTQAQLLLAEVYGWFTECVFRAKIATDSGRTLPPIPVEGCH